MEDLPVEFIDGKKRQRINSEAGNTGENKSMLELENEISAANVKLADRIKRMESIKRQCGFMNGIEADAIGSKGGLSLGWREGLSLTLKSYSKSHIDVEVEEENEAKSWRFMGFYGAPIAHDIMESWELLKVQQCGNNKPWLVAGDFNEILFSFKKNRRIRKERQMEASRKALKDCDLTDLSFSEQWYTWEKGKLVSNSIRERLDRGVANPKWWDLFPSFEVGHLQHSFSDHCPIVVNTNKDGGRQVVEQQWQFRFNADWILNPRCEEHIKNKWEHFQLRQLKTCPIRHIFIKKSLCTDD
ncbi:reverse transcriptase [Gossypium australe]|uniref:Reverse transcriptase n=1 Tax=Gossypium australe TaxID=47621 RepID=A0A5B6V6L4_9ROSI|nr:reverse transcriptase [Gossypium australe]